jgi:hypothetical protein
VTPERSPDRIEIKNPDAPAAIGLIEGAQNKRRWE